MLTLIRDLFGHEAWADAEMWSVIDTIPNPEREPKLLEQLNHLHVVQRFFFSTVQGQSTTRDELSRQMSLSELRDSFRKFHSDVDRYLPKLRESRLNDYIEIPWFPSFQPKVYEALTQAAMHSVHHRAQIATILRQRGGEPKVIDFIVWVSKDRPAPSWTAAATV
jgi:uncharacterized damage-inducible protein DinB